MGKVDFSGNKSTIAGSRQQLLIYLPFRNLLLFPTNTLITRTYTLFIEQYSELIVMKWYYLVII